MEGVIRAAKLLGRAVPFSIEQIDGTNNRVAYSQALPPALILKVSEQVLVHYGVARIRQITVILKNRGTSVADARIASIIKACRDDFQWLDERFGVFVLLNCPRSRLLFWLRKILHVANPLSLQDLLGAVQRAWPELRLSPSLLRGFCQQIPGLRVSGEIVSADQYFHSAKDLNSIEKVIVEVIRDHGGIIQRADLEHICMRLGINRKSFYDCLGRTPILVKVGKGVYALLGEQRRRECLAV